MNSFFAVENTARMPHTQWNKNWKGHNMGLMSLLERFIMYMVGSVIGGSFMGAMMAGLSFLFARPSSESLIGVAFPLGIVVGGIFGLLSFWPLRKEDMGRIVTVLFLSSASFGLCGILISALFISRDLCPVASWFASMLGYWVGVIIVGLGNPFKGKNGAGESNMPVEVLVKKSWFEGMIISYFAFPTGCATDFSGANRCTGPVEKTAPDQEEGEQERP